MGSVLARPLKCDIRSALSRIEAAERVLVLINFDGTPIPIGGEKAELPANLSDWMRGVAAGERVTVGIASGRSVDDLIAAARMDQIVFAGNHGNEIRGLGLHFVEPIAFLCEPALRELVEQMNDCLRDTKFARMEHKRYTATLHLRGSETEERRFSVAALLHAMQGRDRLTLAAEAESIEILPNNGWDMAEAVRWIAGRLGLTGALIVYAGSDAADESVFEAFREHVTVKVGRGPSLAEYAVDGPPELWQFVRHIGDGMVIEPRSVSG